MKKTFNKLVRDNIPDKIRSNGEECVTRKLSDEEYKIELYKKLLEETKEVINSKNSHETIEESADVLEIIKSIAELNDKVLEDIIEIANQKRKSHGGFDKRIFLETTYDKNDIKERKQKELDSKDENLRGFLKGFGVEDVDSYLADIKKLEKKLTRKKKN